MRSSDDHIKGKTVRGMEALAGAVVGACAGVLLVSVPWMWRTFTSGAPLEQTAIARTIASGIERVSSLFIGWPAWGAGALVGAAVGTLVGLIVGSIAELINKNTAPELPGASTGAVIGVLTGFVLLGSIGTLMAGYGLGLAVGLLVGISSGGWGGLAVGGLTGEIACGFIGKFNEQQHRRVREERQKEQRIEQQKIYSQIDALVAYFIEKVQEVGSPGLTHPEDDPALNNPYVSVYAHLGKGKGDRAKLPWHPRGVWWSGVCNLQFACIYPDGKWKYIAPIFDNRTDEVDSYWEILSMEDREEPDLSFPLESSGATHEDAYNAVRTLITEQLTMYNPGTLAELPFS